MKMLLKPALITAFLALGIAGANAQTTPSTVDSNAAQKSGQAQPPKTTGAMDNAVGGLATSPEDVKRQTEGQPTTAQEGKGQTATDPKPGTTQHSPGTVGASPGTTPPMGQKQ
jgi:hypothetical protein